MGKSQAVDQLHGVVKAIKTAGLASALYRLGGIRPFLTMYANSLHHFHGQQNSEKKNDMSNIQSQSLFILLSAVQLDVTFSTDFQRLSG